MTLILNPKAKELHDKWIHDVLGANPQHPLRRTVMESPLWDSVVEYIPLLKTNEVLKCLMLAIESGCKVDLNCHDFDSAMHWDDTPQGHHYWENINSITLENGL